ncbi:hypothetical protein [Spirillospora sp. NPDC029432]|uniref:hypothetical protein n=1 Tax=Spirillospora sp. NPDC029432 TaxID=3154599 RepID=UPI003454C0E9
MTEIKFEPGFRHVEWVDNRDRVQAGGPNGFNVRFTAIRKDLETISGAVSAIDTAIKKLSQQAPPEPRRLSLPPLFTPVGSTPPWTFDAAGTAVRPDDEAEVAGQMTVPLPDKVRLLELRVLGRNTGQDSRLNIVLGRVPLVGSTAPERLAQVLGDDTFDFTSAVDESRARVDMSAFRYQVSARVTGAVPGDTVTLSSVQIKYIAD